MATIANLTVKADDSFEGTLATLTVSAPALAAATENAPVWAKVLRTRWGWSSRR